MDGQSDQQLIAQERNTEITLAPAHLYYRKQLATAAAGTDEYRINQVINNSQFFIKQSPNRDKATTKDRVPGTMMTDLAIHGSPEMQVRCQVPYIAHINAMKGDRAEDYEPREAKDKALFEDFGLQQQSDLQGDGECGPGVAQLQVVLRHVGEARGLGVLPPPRHNHQSGQSKYAFKWECHNYTGCYAQDNLDNGGNRAVRGCADKLSRCIELECAGEIADKNTKNGAKNSRRLRGKQRSNTNGKIPLVKQDFHFPGWEEIEKMAVNGARIVLRSKQISISQVSGKFHRVTGNSHNSDVLDNSGKSEGKRSHGTRDYPPGLGCPEG